MSWWKPSKTKQVLRLMSRWQRYQLIALDEVGYVPLADIGAEFLFQVISDRAERAAIIVTTKLTVFRVDDRVSEPKTLQSAVGSNHGSGAHHRDGSGIVSLPAHDGKEEEILKHGRRGRAVCRVGKPPAQADVICSRR
jgi:hypothetical protein